MTASPEVPAARVPLLVLGGWLGAGKTTVVNRLLRAAEGRRIAVLVNDFGDLSVDADLIVGGEGSEVLALAGGCLCCSFGDDLVGTLRRVARRSPAPDVIVVECSGVALPGVVARGAALAPEVAVQGVAGVVDASALRRLAADPYVGDTVRQQLAQADLLLVNQVDRVDAPALAALDAWLEATAPGVRRVTCRHGELPAELLLGVVARAADLTHPENELTPLGAGTAGRYRAVPGPVPDAERLRHETRRFDGAVDIDALRAALAAEPGLLRAKGRLRGEDGRVWTLQAMGRRVEAVPLDAVAAGAASSLGLLACIRLAA